jgi:ubiquinone biosynthesis monooxygenase Coq7
MSSRTFSLADRILGEIDRAIKILASPVYTARAAPCAAAHGGEAALNESERLESIRLMRVNHSGEVAAQALYRGQALGARDSAVSDAMHQAAAEEMDHLAWCEQRLSELHGRTSYLNPLWYAGSLAIGAVAGAIGDRTSLGFITETERQVESHLHDHMERLPQADGRSRLILEQMAADEVRHGAMALALGGKELPNALREAMRLASRVMTRGSYWL